MSWDELPVDWRDNVVARLTEVRWRWIYRYERDQEEWIDLGGEG